MTIIGTFSPTDTGGFNGWIRTDTLNAKATILRVAEGGDPQYRVFLGRDELGQAWQEAKGEAMPHLKVRLEHPSFGRPIEAHLAPRDAKGRVYSLTCRSDGED